MSLAIILPIMKVAPPFQQMLLTHTQGPFCVQYLRILLSSFGAEDFLKSPKRNQIFAFCQYACYDGLGLVNYPASYEAPPAGGFREEVENVKMWFLSHNFVANVGGITNT